MKNKVHKADDETVEPVAKPLPFYLGPGRRPERDAVCAAIEKILGGKRLTAPTPQQIHQLAPQLSMADIEQLFELLQTNFRVCFFGPSVLVRGLTHRYCLRKEATEADNWLHYIGTDGPRPDGEDNPLSSRAALAWGQLRWPDLLVERTWGQVVAAEIAGHGKQRPGMAAMLLRADFDIFQLTDDEPVSELLDDGIQYIVSEPAVYQEVCHAEPWAAWTHFCGACSGGLLSSQCSTCRIPPVTRSDARATWAAPMPRKLTQVLEASGCVFPIDPLQARLKEHRDWCDRLRKNQPTPRYGKYLRHMDLSK